MMNKALNGDVNAAKYVENFHNSDFFEDSEDELDVLLSGIIFLRSKVVRDDQ